MNVMPSEGGVDYRFIANSSCDWESWLSPEGRLLWLSPSVHHITGYTVEECLGMADYPFPILDRRDHAALRRVVAEGMEGGQGNDMRLRLNRRDATLMWAALSWQGLRDAQGTPKGVRLSVRDLRGSLADQSLNRYQEAISAISRDSKLTSGDWREAMRGIVMASARALDVLRAGVWLMSDERDVIVPEILYDMTEGRFIKGGIVPRSDYPTYFRAVDQDRVIAADDAWYDSRTAELLEDYMAPLGIRALLDAPIIRGGKTVGVLRHEHHGTRRHWTPAEIGFSASMADLCAMALDAAKREELECLHRKLAAILEATPDFVGMADIGGHATYINFAGRQLVGLTPDEELDGWNIDHLYTDEARRQRDEIALPTATRKGVWSGESRFRDRHGAPFPVSQVLIAHKDGKGDVKSYSTVARDLRPWKAIEADLTERERFLSTLLSNLPGVAYRRRNAPGWPMAYISQGCLELTGYPAERLMANDPPFNDLLNPADHDKVYAEVDAAMAEKRPFRVEYRLRRADGSEIWVWSMGRGVYDDDGELIAREGFIGDITQRVLAQLELERLNAELEARVADRTARLKEANQNLESFAYSVSHDLKAPLRGIDGYSRLLVEEYRDRLPDEARFFLENIRVSSERMNQLIDDLLTYSRLERRPLTATDVALAKLIERVLAEREIELTETDAEVDNEVGTLRVSADGEALVQVVRNLVDNALKFSRDSHPPHIVINADVRDGKVIISVSDNGCGFDMKYHDRIFDIFQRLHRTEDYPGTGVGLAIVRKAAERMGGRVWAESVPGAGATFFLELPQ